MNDFWGGFDKRADEGRKKSWAMPALGAAAAGVGTYAALRAGKKGRLVKTLMRDAPKSSFGRLAHRLAHGVDEMAYVPTRKMRAPKTPKKLEGTVLHEDYESSKFFKGDKNIGAISKKRENLLGDKLTESKLLNKVAPSVHMKTEMGSKVKDLGKKMKGDYLLKARGGAASGVGGGAFLHKADIDKHLAGKGLGVSKNKLLADYKKNPGKYVQQAKTEIKKGPLSGASREMRVHVIDGKVVPGASMPRGGNFEDVFSTGQAEKAMQKAIAKMPASQKKNLTMAADVAMTKSGPKVIELNRGAHASGLLDPDYLWKAHKHNPLSAATAVGSAVKGNQAVYKHVTGRSSELSAGLKGVGAGLGAAAITRAAQNHMPQRQQQMQQPNI